MHQDPTAHHAERRSQRPDVRYPRTPRQRCGRGCVRRAAAAYPLVGHSVGGLARQFRANIGQAGAIPGIAPLLATGPSLPFRGGRRFEMKMYDLVVIGSGTAAQVASARVRKAGRTVAVVDHRPFGGTCALRGCDPKKMLISGAEAIDAASRMRGHGTEGSPRVNWRELMAFKRSFTDPIPHKQEQRYTDKGIDAFHGLACFTGPDAITVKGQELKARYILIASGARPVPLQIPGEEHIITSDRFLELDTLPASIALVGGGYIAAEFSHIAARAGSRVTVLQ